MPPQCRDKSKHLRPYEDTPLGKEATPSSTFHVPEPWQAAAVTIMGLDARPAHRCSAKRPRRAHAPEPDACGLEPDSLGREAASSGEGWRPGRACDGQRLPKERIGLRCPEPRLVSRREPASRRDSEARVSAALDPAPTPQPRLGRCPPEPSPPKSAYSSPFADCGSGVFKGARTAPVLLDALYDGGRGALECSDSTSALSPRIVGTRLPCASDEKRVGKGGALRWRDLPRVFFWGVTRPAVRRLGRCGGVKRLEGIFPLLRCLNLPYPRTARAKATAARERAERAKRANSAQIAEAAAGRCTRLRCRNAAAASAAAAALAAPQRCRSLGSQLRADAPASASPGKGKANAQTKSGERLPRSSKPSASKQGPGGRRLIRKTRCPSHPQRISGKTRSPEDARPRRNAEPKADDWIEIEPGLFYRRPVRALEPAVPRRAVASPAPLGSRAMCRRPAAFIRRGH